MRDRNLPSFRITSVGVDQRAMLELLGKPEIVGSAWSDIAYADDDEEEEECEGVLTISPWLVTPHLCPVAKILGRLRMVLPNGDLVEVDAADVQSPPEYWSGDDSEPGRSYYDHLVARSAGSTSVAKPGNDNTLSMRARRGRVPPRRPADMWIWLHQAFRKARALAEHIRSLLTGA